MTDHNPAAVERGRAEVRAAVEAVRSDADWLADWSHSPPAGVLFGDLARMTRLAYGVRAALSGDPAVAVAAIKPEGAVTLDREVVQVALWLAEASPRVWPAAMRDGLAASVAALRDALGGEAGA